ncbi:MAG: diguanylate cyclase [Phormidesmis sp.]
MLQRKVELPLIFRQDKDRSIPVGPAQPRQQVLSAEEGRLQLKAPEATAKLSPPVTASEQLHSTAHSAAKSDHNSPGKGSSPANSEQPLAVDSSKSNPSLPSAFHSDAISAFESHILPSSSSSLQNQRSQNQRLRQVERKLRSSLNLATVLGATVVETAAFFQAKQVSLLRHDSLLHRWELVAQYCGNQDLAWQQPFAFSADEFPALVEALQQGQAVCISVGMDEAAPEEVRRWQSQWSGNWLLMPVKRRQTMGYSLNGAVLGGEAGGGDDNREHWGVMALACTDQQAWSRTAVVLSQSIVVELEWAIAQAHQHQELMLANQELQKLALSDGLTRLANRRRFDEHLSDEWQRLARDRQPLSLILCDLDHFKRYNDTFGHPAGDRCLIRVARALLNGPQRPADLVARYGGEEFAVILPNTDTHGAWRIAQKIHENIRALKIEHSPDNEEQYVTVTMGVSTVLPGHNSTAQMLVQASDLALYHAKQQGRNRTYVHAHYNTVEANFQRVDAPLDMTP